MVEKRPALGRGLSALIPDSPAPVAGGERSLDVDTDLLRPNKFQPRTQMDDERMEAPEEERKVGRLAANATERELEANHGDESARRSEG